MTGNSDSTRILDGGGGRRVLAGRYALRGLLGQGGMADVQLAHDQMLDRQVAVKILHAQYAEDPQFIARFRREAQAAARMAHASVVGVYDTGEDDGRPFIVMEYVAGKTLRDVLNKEGVSAERAIEIGSQAALALDYAHDRGLVHRDVKPANIMISDEGLVKVADFGIARAVGAETVTQTAAVFGTAAYIAPEQAQGHDVDRRTDVYALGVVLYEMLTGQQPFQGESAVTLAYKHVSEPPTPPSHLTANVSPELEAIVLKAMAKDPADRYQTARDLHDDLQRLLQGMAITAPLGGAALAAAGAAGHQATSVMTPTTQREVVDERWDDEKDDRAGAGRQLAIGALLLLLLLGGALLLWSLLNAQPDQIEVPDVVGQDVASAQTALQEAGFSTQLDPVEDPQVPENEVMTTDPGPGEFADEGSTVVITYSEGPPLVAVPDVSGQSEDAARAALADAGLVPGERSEAASEDVAEGSVIETNPSAGTEVQADTEVAYTVSTGPPPVTVPDVRDRTEDEARGVLSDAGFSTTVEREHHDSVEEGRVIRQSPGAGESVERGATVTIVISRGPEEEPEPEPDPDEEEEEDDDNPGGGLGLDGPEDQHAGLGGPE